jgi:hypothetical protein
MAPITYEIDRNADIVITLKNPTIVFAPWDENDVLQQWETAIRISGIRVLQGLPPELGKRARISDRQMQPSVSI